MDRASWLAWGGVVVALAATVALTALLTAGGLHLARSMRAPVEPVREARVTRVVRTLEAISHPARAQAGRARLDGARRVRTSSLGPAIAPSARSSPADDLELWAAADAGPATPVRPSAPVEEVAVAIDPDEDLSDFDLELGPRGGAEDTGRGRRR